MFAMKQFFSRFKRFLSAVCAAPFAVLLATAPLPAQAAEIFGSAALAWVMGGPPCVSDPGCTFSIAPLAADASAGGAFNQPGSAVAHANLTTGYVSAGTSSPGVSVPDGGQMAVSASALIWDTLTFSGAAPGAMATLTMTGTWNLLGDGRAYAFNSLQLLSDITNVTDVYGTAIGTNNCSDAIACNVGWWLAGSGSTTMWIDGLGGNVTTFFQQPSTAQALPGPAYSVQQSFPIYNDVPMIVFLGVTANSCVHGGYDCAPSSTFITDPLSFNLPEGVIFTSASGGFSAAPVPEPETYAMLLAGLGVLGFAARRRRQAQAS